MTYLKLSAVRKQFGDAVALESLSLSVPRGEFLSMLGPSGCGKTTLLRMVNRMVSPTSGSVWIDDLDVATTDPVALRRRIGYVMQNAGLLPHRKVIDNIATVPRLTGVSKAAAHVRALELMDLVFDLVQANRSLLTTATGDGWDVRISWDGFSQVSSKLERPPGFGAMVEVRIGVEATRCS